MAVTSVNVFVYGTLKLGRTNHFTLGSSVFIGEAVTNEASFNMFDGVFPFVSDNFPDEENKGRIVGELYEVKSLSVIDALDRLEGVPTLYVKREIDVTTLDNVPYKATIYVASNGSNTRMKERIAMAPKGRSKLLEWRA